MFDHQLTVNWGTQIAVSFTHSRLVKVKAGPSVTPGTFPLEPDVAESWSQPTETTYVFKLRRGVRWHPKPPVNGRELTAEDVKYTYERFLTVPGNPNRAQLEEVDRIEDARPLYGQVQPQGAVRVVPRRAGDAVHVHHRQGGRRAVR
jgi:ABC-type transport system substrate-binding protein